MSVHGTAATLGAAASSCGVWGRAGVRAGGKNVCGNAGACGTCEGSAGARNDGGPNLSRKSCWPDASGGSSTDSRFLMPPETMRVNSLGPDSRFPWAGPASVSRSCKGVGGGLSLRPKDERCIGLVPSLRRRMPRSAAAGLKPVEGRSRRTRALKMERTRSGSNPGFRRFVPGVLGAPEV